ncbi:MAG: hypothetical protein HZB25_10635 [Candidatus Eisenbacteria bacterium]|nr:hypothetical protein [Candidatus Eisenbacteria bacterium]
MNRSRILGWAMLAYAALTSRTLFRLAAALGAPDTHDTWPLSLDALLWGLMVVGGLGLVLDRGWSRWVAIFASACSLLSLVAGVMVSVNMQSKFGMQPLMLRSSLVWAIAGSLPLLVFLVASWKVRVGPPTAAMVAREGGGPITDDRRQRLDMAYGCFLFLDAVILFFYVVYKLTAFHKPGDDMTPMMAIFVLVPAAFGAALTAVLISLMMWRERTLPLLAVATLAVLFLVAGLVARDTGYVRGPAVDTALLLYLAGSGLLAARWFLGSRRRQV